MESSKKRRSDPLGWKQAYDLARFRAGNKPGSPDDNKQADWDAWVEGWLRTIFPETKQQLSLKTTLMHWRYVRAFMGRKNVSAPKGLTYAIAMEYFEWRQQNRRQMDRPKVQTAVIEMKLLRRVLREAVKRGFIPANPLDGLVLKTPSHKEKPEITPEEEGVIRKAVAAKEAHLPLKDRWMTISFEIAIRHGVRLSETSFPLNRIDFTRWEWLVHQKGDRWRTVPVHPEIRPLLSELRSAGAKFSCVFPDESANTASRLWSLLLRGVDRDNIKGVLPHLCFHCCRVTVVSRLARAGVSEHLVMEFVGHASKTTHAIYRRVHHSDLGQCLVLSTAAQPTAPLQKSGESGTIS